MSKFGEVVKALRLADELTLEAVAKRIGSHKGYISGIENGKVNAPSVKVLRRYQKIFEHRGIKLEDLVELAYVDKSPALVRSRLLLRIQDNPLLEIRVKEREISLPQPAEKAVI